MDEFFPSEIARLVLGYLKESKCENSWKAFLEECSSLHEYVELYKRGKMYPTNVNGKSLTDILKEYCTLKKDAESTSNNEFSGNAFKEKCKMVLEEIVSNATEHILLKYFPSISGSNHYKGTSDMTETINTPEGAKNCIEDGNTSEVIKDVCLVTSENCTTDVTKSSELSAKNCIEYENAVEKNTESAYDDHTPENDSHNFDSNMKLNITDTNTDQSCEHPGSGVNAINGYLTETSVSNSIYLQEIIKVEKDSDSFCFLENSPVKNISDVRSLAMNQNEPSDISSECHNKLSSFKDNSKILRENLSYANSTPGHNKNADKTGSDKLTNSMEVEIIKTIKQEPHSKVNNENKTDTSCFQNSSIIASQDSSSVEISQTALHDTESTIGQFSNLVNNISISTNQSGYTLQTTPFSSQPVAVHDLSFPSVPTYIMPNYSSSTPYMQNNAQFSFVINTSPQWKDTTVGGISLNLPSIHPNSIGPVLTSINSLASNSTPSVPTVCVNNVFRPALTAVDPVISNTPSATEVSFNAIPNPALTTVNSTANEQSPTVSSVPSNVSSFVNTPSTVQAVPIQPKPNLVTESAKSKSNGLSKNKHNSDKVPKRKKTKNASLIKEKEIPPSHLQSRTHPIMVTRRRRGGKQD